MVIVTDAAAAAFRSALEQGDLPGDGGIRLQPLPGAVCPSAMLANEPAPDDAIVIDHGIRIFLDHQLVPLDDDLVIDVATGERAQAGFAVRGPA